MLIFWEQRLVFLATPKAGSTAIAMALESLASASVQRPVELKHSGFAVYQKFVGPWLETQAGGPFTTVALMREPVAWLQSWYRFWQHADLDEADTQVTGISFADFAQQYTASGGPERLGIGSQAQFLTSDAGRVDQIFCYEKMSSFVEFLEDRLDCRIELPRANVPPPVNVDLDATRQACLRQALAEDIDLYLDVTSRR